MIEYAKLQGKTVKYLSSFPDLKTICDYETVSVGLKNKVTAES